MGIMTVMLIQYSSDAALGIVGGALVERAFGKYGDPGLLCHLQGKTEAGSTTANNQNI